jgi:glucose uptake protein
MYTPGSFSTALLMTILTAVFWGSWANTYKGTRRYPFELFYWDYIIGVLICALAFAFTLGSTGGAGESFLVNLRATDTSNIALAAVAGIIFNAANLLLVAGIDIAGLAIAFPIAIGIAVVEGVLLSYALQPKGNPAYLGAGLVLAVAAILFDAAAYRRLTGAGAAVSRKGIIVNVVSGLLMGTFAPFVTRSMTAGHAMTPYGVMVLFASGALACCFVVNIYFMKHPLVGPPVTFAGFPGAGARNHLLGVAGGILWSCGMCLNFSAAGLVGVPISYAIGQSAPMIAALWGVVVWKEFAGADHKAWTFLKLMFASYIAAIGLIALAYNA